MNCPKCGKKMRHRGYGANKIKEMGITRILQYRRWECLDCKIKDREPLDQTVGKT